MANFTQSQVQDQNQIKNEEKNDLVPPQNHQEKLFWIKESYDNFLQHVKDLEDLKQYYS